MCDSATGHHLPQGPSTSQFIANLRQPGPLGWKIQRVLANEVIKLVRRQTCCGHAGEPGC